MYIILFKQIYIILNINRHHYSDEIIEKNGIRNNILYLQEQSKLCCGASD